MTDWQRILLAADKGAEIAAERKADATSKKDTNRWLAIETRCSKLADFALLAIEFGHE